MALFFRLLEPDDKGTALHQAIQQLAQKQPNPNTFTVEPGSFQQVPGAPFAYWVSEAWFSVYKCFKKVDSDERLACLGLQTQNDFRFLLLSFEIPVAQKIYFYL